MPTPADDELADVLRAFGMPALRAGIIRTTMTRGVVTAQDLMDELQVGRTTLVTHTQALVDAGILLQGVDPSKAGAKAGFNRLVWRADADALAAHVEQLRAGLGLPR